MPFPDILPEKLLEQYVWLQTLVPFIRVIILVFVGIPLLYSFSKIVRQRVSRRYTEHLGMLVGKIIYYAGLAYITISVLDDLGFKIKMVLGALGIVGIALGFASQTSVSNIISGLFLIAEKPFTVNDVIKIGDIIGQILSIDLLSIKLRTFDNRFVRIPNEVLIKSPVTNISRFPIRRLDFKVEVDNSQNIQIVREILLDIARRNPSCLQEPEPTVIVSGLTKTSAIAFFSLWVIKEEWLRAQNEIQQEIQARMTDKIVNSSLAGPADLSS